MVTRQGDVCWCDFGPAHGSGPSRRRPCVVIQNNVFNRSRINTTVVCLLTSNLMREGAPGNVALSKGEAGLPKKCIANVSQLMTVDKTDLSEKIGTLRARRLREILAGVQGLLEPADVP